MIRILQITILNSANQEEEPIIFEIIEEKIDNTHFPRLR
jgi:hypothetical protein